MRVDWFGVLIGACFLLAFSVVVSMVLNPEPASQGLEQGIEFGQR